MSYTIGELVDCERMQEKMDAVWATSNPFDVVTVSPALQFLRSQMNMAGIQQRILPGEGKIKTLRVIYDRKRSGSAVVANQANPKCTATRKVGNSFVDYTIDPEVNLQTSQNFTLADLRYNCESNPLWLARQIQGLINELDEAVSENTAIEMAALIGNWGSETDNVTADVLSVRTRRSGATDDVYPFTMQEIQTAARHSAYNGPFAIFSGDELFTYAQLRNAGCCTNQGVDLSAMFSQFGNAVVYDYWLQSALGGQDYALMMGIGALQLLVYNVNQGADGINRVIGPNYYRDVIMSRRTGITYDINLTDTCGDFSLVVTGTTKVVGLPDDMFPEGDQYEGVKWVNKIRVVNS